MRKKGFTLIELIAIILVLGIIFLISTPIISKLVAQAKEESIKISVLEYIDAVEKMISTKLLNGENIPSCYTVSNLESLISIKGTKPSKGIVIINSNGEVESASLCIRNYKVDYKDEKVTIDKGVSCSEMADTDLDCDLAISMKDEYNEEKEVNLPKLNSGMIPVIWNGSSWVTTETDNDTWYDYTEEDKKWANAISIDSSAKEKYNKADVEIDMNDVLAMWVWIPRYAYKISSGYHSSTAGIIDIKFLMGRSSKTTDGLIAEKIPTYVDDKQTNFIVHPAFKFNNIDLPGIWVAKFEASSDQNSNCYSSANPDDCNLSNLSLRILPNANAWRYISNSNAFTTSLNLKKDTTYTWQSITTEVDTHLIKNSEWGAVSYLAQSSIGKNDEVWINNNFNLITGNAGDAASANPGTSYSYETANGMQASTTGNTTGVYDMSGGLFEFTAAYLNYKSDTFTLPTLESSSIYSAKSKYKDTYTFDTYDRQSYSFELASKRYGDALYEVGTTGTGTSNWYNDYIVYPYSSGPFFTKGGNFSMNSVAGIYNTFYSDGTPTDSYGFRPVLVVDNIRPDITLIGDETVYIAKGSTYTDAGATAIDKNDGNVSSKIKVTTDLNPNKYGTYTVVYTVTNSLGNTAKEVRTVEVSDSGWYTPDYCFEFDPSTGTIVRYNTSSQYCNSSNMIVSIPSKINGVTVTTLGMSSFASMSNLDKVYIPNTVTTIGTYAFASSSVKEVNLPDSLTTIGDGAFQLSGITSVEIPSGIKTVPYNAFYNCPNLRDVVVPSTVDEVVSHAFEMSGIVNLTVGARIINYFSFGWLNSLEQLTILDGVETINEFSFYSPSASNIESAILPDTVTFVGYQSFAGNFGEVSIPTSVQTVDHHAFENALIDKLIVGAKNIGEFAFERSEINNLEILDGVETIGRFAFLDNNITSVILPDSVRTLDFQSFGNNQITTVRLSSSLETMDAFVFDGSVVQDLTIPDGAKVIGYAAFHDCQIEELIIPDSVTTIGESAFYQNQIISLKLSKNLVSIGNRAFYGNSLTNLVIPSGITSIDGDNAFEYNYIENLTIPSTLKTIANNAFANNLIKNLNLPNSVISIGEGAFFKNQIDALTIPNSVTSIGAAAFNSNKLSDASAFIFGRNSDGTTNNNLVSYGGIKKADVVIPSNITVIGDRSFYNSNLTSVSIPSSVTSIGSLAFAVNNLTSINIPSSVISISDDAFSNNYIAQGSAVINNMPSSVSVASSAFYNNGDEKTTNIAPSYIYEDKNNPVITINGSSSITIEAGSTYNDQGATATDVEDGNITDKISTTSTVLTNILGTYNVTYTVSDYIGNSVTAVRTVRVVDTTPPVITLKGSNPASAALGYSYTDAGVTVTDNYDSSLTATSTGTVDTSVIGSYTITYNATDSNGNIATAVTRTVNVAEFTSYAYTMTNRLPVYGITGAVYPPTGWTGIQNASGDDSFKSVPLPFSVKMFGTSYNSVYVGSNSYITFGGGSSSFSGLSASNPAYNKIIFGGSDNSYQRVSYYSTSKYVRIRYEGTASSSGTVGSPNIVVELTIFNPEYTINNSTVIEMLVGNHGRTSGVSNISNAAGTISVPYTLTPSTSYVFLGDSTGGNFQVFKNAKVTNVDY